MSAEPASPRFAPKTSALLVCALLVLVVAALYAQTGSHEFLSYDDASYLTENPQVRGGLDLSGARWAFLEVHAANWHPLTWLSHQLDVELFGLRPGPHHLVNAGLHALNAVLCFLFLRAATASTWASALVALLFAVHPQRVESVAWAAERKDVLSGTFFFLTLLAYLRHARAPARPRLALVSFVFALGLMAKPMLVTLPVVLLLLDAWPLGRWGPSSSSASFRRAPPRALLLEKVPLFVLALASALVTIVAQRTGEALSSIEVLSPAERVATALLGVVSYLGDAFWPARLAFFYPHPALVTGGVFAPFGARVCLAGVLIVLATIGAWRVRRACPSFLVGWSWMLVMLLPVSGLVQVGTQLYADRYAYLPLLGIPLALVFGARELVRAPHERRGLFALGLAWAAILAAVAQRQVGFWKDSGTLCERALAVTERNYVALEHLALQHQRRGELELALQRYEETLAIAPLLHDAHSNLGTVLMQLGRRERAVEEYREALRLEPGYLHARLNWGMLFELEGDHAGALEQYRLAVEEHPAAPSALTKLGDALLATGLAGEALEVYERSLARPGLHANTHCGLGEALTATGDEPGARAHFEQALAIRPDLARGLHGLAWIRATSPAGERREPARALELLGRCAASGEGASWQHQRVLAATLAALGHFPEAARTAAEAGARAPRSARPQLESERALYAAGQALVR